MLTPPNLNIETAESFRETDSIDAAKEDLLRKRQYVVKEIQSTEELYVKRLKSTLEVFVSPLRVAKCLESQEFQKQFSVLENIYDLHAKYFDVENPEVAFNYLRLLDDVCNNSFLYSQYLVDFEPSMQRRGHLVTTNRKFADFLDKALSDPRLGGQGLESLLILPVQRIPRYRLLLEQLLKFTPEDHEQREQVDAALSRICEVNRDNNEAIRARENRQKIMEVMMSMESRSRVDLLGDHQRRFVKEGALFRQCRRAPKEFQFWLFTDKLLYGQRQPLGDFTLHREISLSQCFVRTMDSPQMLGQGQAGCDPAASAAWFPFTVESPSKSFVVLCSKESDRAEWVEAICSAIARQHARLSQEMGSVAPIWTPDSTSTSCLRCERAFTIFQRRHHCRACGKVLCDSCSNWRCMLRQVDAHRPVRVCQLCFEQQNPAAEEAEAGGGGAHGGPRLGLLHVPRPNLLQTARSLRSLSLFAFSPSSKSAADGEDDGDGRDGRDGDGDDTVRRSSDSEMSDEGRECGPGSGSGPAGQAEGEVRVNPILREADQVRVEVSEEDLADFKDFLDGRPSSLHEKARAAGDRPAAPEESGGSKSPSPSPSCLPPPKPPKSGKTLLPCSPSIT